MPAALSSKEELNINPSILDEDWFHVVDARKHVPFATRAIRRMYLTGDGDAKLEVCKSPSGHIATSKQALKRYAKARNK